MEQDNNSQLIGQGLQYKVFDIGGDRVHKIPLSAPEAKAVLEKWYSSRQFQKLDSEKIILRSIDQTNKTSKKVRYLLDYYPELASMLGYPVFVSDTEYTQEKVELLDRDWWELVTEEEAHQQLESFAQLILTQWQYGFSDTVFNFSINNGLDKNKQLILIDFGEVRFSKSDVRRRINTQRWLKAWSYRDILPDKYKTYYADMMSSALTNHNLDANWRSKLH